MTMPHPRTMMIPFGVVILLSKTGSHATVEMYSSKTAIEKLHPALVGLGTVIRTNDDFAVTKLTPNAGRPAVIAKKTITVNKNHKAYMVKKSDKAATKQLVLAADFNKPMKAGWFYWLEPA